MIRTCSFALLLACWACGASAQTAAVSEPDGYQAVVTEAVSEYEAGSYVEARELFRLAHEMFPNARALRGLGITEFELKNYVAAAQCLELSLAHETKPLVGTMREKTEALLERTRGYLGVVKVQVRPNDATMTVDGEAVALPLSAPLLLAVGDHVLRFRAPGRLEQQRTISVRGRQTHSVVLELVDIRVTADSLREGDRDDRRTPLYRKWWLWTAVGVAAAGIATGVSLSLLRREVITERPYTTPNTPQDGALSTR